MSDTNVRETVGEPTSVLASHEIEFFRTNGFLSLSRITTDEEVAWLGEVYERLFREQVGKEDGVQFDLGAVESGQEPVLPQLLRPSRYAPELRETVFVRNASVIAAQVLGADLDPDYFDHMIFKPALRGSVTPWHQDQAYHDPTVRHRSVNFWMPLDGATVDSGCLQFVPGSNRGSVLPHHHINNDPAVHGLEVDEPERYTEYAAACPLPPGGCSMHASYMLHYAGPNTSPRPRRAYILQFKGTSTPLDVPVDNYWITSPQRGR